MSGVSDQAPVYVRIREIIRGKIEEGDYPPCTAVPSELELAELYGISRQTVHGAIDALINEGLLRRVPGKGVYVLGRKVERDLDKLQGFTQTMLDNHLTPSVKVISKLIRKAGEKYALMFGIQPDDDIYYIKRLCCADTEPVSLEEIYIPRYLVPKMEGICLSSRSMRSMTSTISSWTAPGRPLTWSTWNRTTPICWILIPACLSCFSNAPPATIGDGS